MCKITQLEKQDNRKCIFATDGILEQNSVLHTFKCVATVTCLIMVALHCCFCGGQWLFINPCDIRKVSRLLTEKKGQLRKEVPSVAMMTNFGPPVDCTKLHSSLGSRVWGKGDCGPFESPLHRSNLGLLQSIQYR